MQSRSLRNDETRDAIRRLLGVSIRLDTSGITLIDKKQPCYR